MDVVIRAAVIYAFLWLILRGVGKRELAQLNPFELVLLIVTGDLIQQAVTLEDHSLVGAGIIIVHRSPSSPSSPRGCRCGPGASPGSSRASRCRSSRTAGRWSGRCASSGSGTTSSSREARQAGHLAPRRRPRGDPRGGRVHLLPAPGQPATGTAAACRAGSPRRTAPPPDPPLRLPGAGSQPVSREEEQMADIKVGDPVSWNTSQGRTHGKVVKRLTSRTKVGGTEIHATKDDPRWLVESDATGAPGRPYGGGPAEGVAAGTTPTGGVGPGLGTAGVRAERTSRLSPPAGGGGPGCRRGGSAPPGPPRRR